MEELTTTITKYKVQRAYFSVGGEARWETLKKFNNFAAAYNEMVVGEHNKSGDVRVVCEHTVESILRTIGQDERADVFAELEPFNDTGGEGMRDLKIIRRSDGNWVGVIRDDGKNEYSVFSVFTDKRCRRHFSNATGLVMATKQANELVKETLEW